MVRYDEAIKMIEDGQVTNAKIVKLNNTNIVVSNPGLKNLKVIDDTKSNKLEAIARIESNNKLAGYVLKDSNNREFKLTSNKVWDLAIKGDISNIKATINNKSKCLIGVDIKLCNLHKITI